MTNLVISDEFSHILKTDALEKMSEVLEKLRTNFDHYTKLLEFSEALDADLMGQASLYCEVTRELSKAISVEDTLKYAKDACKSYAELKTRQIYEDDDQFQLPFTTKGILMAKLSKYTEPVIKSTIESFDSIIALENALLKAKYVADRYKGLEQSFKQRSINLTKLVDFNLALVKTPDSIYEKSKQSMNEQRGS